MSSRKKKGSIHGVIGPPKLSSGEKNVSVVVGNEGIQPAPAVPPNNAQVPSQQFQQQQHQLAAPQALQAQSNSSINNNNFGPAPDDVILSSFTAQPSKTSVDENLLETLGIEIQRAMSAPPAMEFSSNNIFSFQSKYSHLFGGWDIRNEEEYENFYNSHNNQEKPLPPPFESNFWVPGSTPQWGGWNDQNQQDGKYGFYDELQSLSLNDYQGGNHKEVNMQHLEKAALDLTEPDAAAWEASAKQSIAQPIAQKPNQGKQRSMSYSSVAASTAPQPMMASVAMQQQQMPPSRIVTPPAMAIASPSSESQEDFDSSMPPMSLKSPSPTNQKKDKNASSSSNNNNNNTAAAAANSSTPSKYNNISEVIGKIYQLSKDQHGCRFLQKKLEEGNADDLEAIYNEVYPHIVELMTDPFGNYLCQKLVEFCNEKQKTAIITAVAPALVKISMNMHGTRAVQKLIECLASPVQINKVIDALRHHVVPLIKDLNGNHVIQRCLQKMSYLDKQYIYDAVAPRCVDVATHKHGCCVLQRCIDYAGENQKMMLVKEVINHALELVQNAFGNYVVQYILDLGNDDVNSLIIEKFLGHITILSQNKFSSNVIEKCLRISNSRMRGLLIIDICNAELISILIQDNFGNYVLQTALTVCDPKQFQDLGDAIRPLLHLVKNTPYGKKIESKLNKKPSGSYRPQQQQVSRGGNTSAPFSPKKK